jgi:hypothetical protein
MPDFRNPDSTALRTLLEKCMRVAALAVSGLFVLLFLYVALRRLHYPFELDRMESAMMTSVWRLAHNHSLSTLYSRPSLEWVPFLYAPFYFYCSAFVAKFTGLNYCATRLVSILATLGSFGIIYAMVKRETGRFDAALLSVGLFASLYATVLGWYDVGRVDMLSIFFLLLAIYCTRYHHPLMASLVWLLAFQTKQSMLPIAILVFLTGWQRPRRMIVGIIATVVLIFGSIHLCNHLTGGYYGYYAFGTAALLKFIPRMALLYIPVDLFGPLGIAIAIVTAAVLVRVPSRKSPSLWFYGLLTFVITGSTGFVRAHDGANMNALIPVYAWISILFGLAMHRLLQACKEDLQPGITQMIPSMLWLLVLIQLSAHIYQPARFIPSADALQHRQKFFEALASTPGDVWLLNHSFDGIRAGKPVHPEMDALDAVLGRASITLAEPDAAAGTPAAQLLNAFRSQHFTAIVFDRSAESYSPPWAFNGATFTAHYPLRALAIGSDQASVTDQPVLVYFPCSALQTPAVVSNLTTSFIDRSHCN